MDLCTLLLIVVAIVLVLCLFGYRPHTPTGSLSSLVAGVVFEISGGMLLVLVPVTATIWDRRLTGEGLVMKMLLSLFEYWPFSLMAVYLLGAGTTLIYRGIKEGISDGVSEKGDNSPHEAASP